MTLKFYNTASRLVEDFKPRQPGQVGVYSCGPTVYSTAHLGNMRTFIFADLLRRTLTVAGLEVRHVMNITDVGHLTGDGDDGEDKLEQGAKREGLSAWDIAAKYTDEFFTHCEALAIKRPHIVCKATDHIPEQLAMIERLKDRGYTYQTSDGIYFDTTKFPTYGKFAKLDVDGLQDGHRVSLGEKRHKCDFALWKFSPSGEQRAMEWQSPFGIGFPGWHLECSAMAQRYLGDQFDIHTGGADLIPIHHTNEIAQSECSSGKKPFVSCWMHGEFLLIDDAPKMSKSLGNSITVTSLKESGYDPLAFRLLCLQSHYRKQMRFSLTSLEGASKALGKLEAFAQTAVKAVADCDPDAGDLLTSSNSDSLKNTSVYQQWKERYPKYLEHCKPIEAAMFHDLNAPQALAACFAAVDRLPENPLAQGAVVLCLEELLGLPLLRQKAAFAAGKAAPEELQKALKEREAARAQKDWQEADRLRKLIEDAGFEILDKGTSHGPVLKRKMPTSSPSK